jgi:hypothetical protein
MKVLLRFFLCTRMLALLPAQALSAQTGLWNAALETGGVLVDEQVAFTLDSNS